MSDKEMTDNEKKAREILNLGFKGNILDDLIRLIEKQAGTLPGLTDQECINIAGNFPVSLQEIRKTFPSISAGGSNVGLEAQSLKKQLDMLLCVVNAVTCQHRHGLKPREKDLTRLSNRQIEVEEALRDMGY